MCVSTISLLLRHAFDRGHSATLEVNAYQDAIVYKDDAVSLVAARRTGIKPGVDDDPFEIWVSD